MLNVGTSGESRISQTGAPTSEFGVKTVIWQDFCQKLNENEKYFGRKGHVSLFPPPPPTPWIRQWQRYSSPVACTQHTSLEQLVQYTAVLSR